MLNYVCHVFARNKENININKRKRVGTGNAVNAYLKDGKSVLSSCSILALESGTLKHFTFFSCGTTKAFACHVIDYTHRSSAGKYYQYSYVCNEIGIARGNHVHVLRGRQLTIKT